MASACVNNLGVSPDNFLDCPSTTFPSYGWLTTPRLSFTLDDSNSKIASPPLGPQPPPPPAKSPADAAEIPDLEIPVPDAGDFEFRLDDSVTMLPADELFSDGKLVPLQRPSVVCGTMGLAAAAQSEDSRMPEAEKSGRKTEVLSTSTNEACLFSPKAPRCSSRWKELLGLKKSCQGNHKSGNTTSSNGGASTTSKSIRQFLHRSSKSASFSSAGDGSLSLPLLKDSDCESASSSRLSLSSSSSGHDVDDLRRLSLDADKPSSQATHISLPRSSSGPGPNPNTNPPKVRLVKPRQLIDHPTAPPSTTRVGRTPMNGSHQDPATIVQRGVSVDSPRMNSSGKIVFQSLERSSSSPSSFNGGPRYKYRGMERSYSANVRITPFLNVPVCSLRGSSKSGVFGFGQLFSSSSSSSSSSSTSQSHTSTPQKKDGCGNGSGNGKISHHLHHNHPHQSHHHHLQPPQTTTTTTTNGKNKRGST
ncbi:hypothetical protein Dimus_005028 [Dionaea muscipula]